MTTSNPTTDPTTTSTTNPGPNTGARFRRTIIAAMAVAALTSLFVAGSAGAASAHDGHGPSTDTATTRTTSTSVAPSRTSTSVAPSRTSTSVAPSRTSTESVAVDRTRNELAAREIIERFHLAAINDIAIDDVTIGRGTDDRGRPTGDLIQTPGPGQANPLNVDCYVDFDDDLVLQYHIPGGAENTFMTNHWFQKCFDDYHPAVAVKFLNYGHFHLGYEDPRVGPCAGSQADWGRKADAPPADDDAFGDWVMADCVSDIDPITEPRSGLSAHSPGHRGQIVAYDGDGYLPFTLRTFEVVAGEVEVCHLPPGPIEAAGPGGSPWQCTVLGEGYWDMSNHVPNAIEVRFEFLTNGQIDNIGVDLNQP